VAKSPRRDATKQSPQDLGHDDEECHGALLSQTGPANIANALAYGDGGIDVTPTDRSNDVHEVHDAQNNGWQGKIAHFTGQVNEQ
jgi:hypothetical protein